MTPSAPPPGARAARPTPGTATARLCASGFVVSQRENNGPGHVTVLRASVRRGWQAVFPKAVGWKHEKTFGLLHAVSSTQPGAAAGGLPTTRSRSSVHTGHGCGRSFPSLPLLRWRSRSAPRGGRVLTALPGTRPVRKKRKRAGVRGGRVLICEPDGTGVCACVCSRRRLTPEEYAGAA